jgi:hypothetical protein
LIPFLAVFQGTIKPNGRTTMHTTIGHIFTFSTLVSETAPDSRMVDFFIATGQKLYRVSPDHYLGHDSCVQPSPSEQLSLQQETFQGTCNNVGLIFYDASMAHWHKTRLALNFAQVS